MERVNGEIGTLSDWYEPYMILSHCAINDFVPHLI